MLEVAHSLLPEILLGIAERWRYRVPGIFVRTAVVTLPDRSAAPVLRSVPQHTSTGYAVITGARGVPKSGGADGVRVACSSPRWVVTGSYECDSIRPRSAYFTSSSILSGRFADHVSE